MKVSIVIPTLNEEDSIEEVLEEGQKYSDKIIVVDGYSTDRTKEIVKNKFPEVDFYQVLGGKGKGLRFGFEKAMERNSDFIVMIDGDGEKTPKDIPKLIKNAKENNLDVVFGERSKKGMRSKFRKLFNKFGLFWINLLTSYNLKDAFSGFNLLNRESVEKMDLRSDNFEIETEIVLESFKNNLRVGSSKIKILNFSDSKCNIKNFIEISKFYNDWVLEKINEKDLNLSFGKKILLEFFCRTGNFLYFFLLY